MEPFSPSYSLPKGKRTYINEHGQLVSWPGWIELFRRYNSATDDNLRRALLWCKDDWDREEVQAEIDRRVANRKEKAAVRRFGLTEKAIENAPSILQLVYSRIPKKPYVTNNFDAFGSKIVRKEHCAAFKELQINAPWSRQAIIFDIDHDKELDPRLPPPNFVVINPENQHKHAVIVLKTPAMIGPKASTRAQLYYRDIGYAVGQTWGADINYRGTTMHNPFNDLWGLEVFQNEPYDLSAFKPALEFVKRRDMPANHPRYRGTLWEDGYGLLGRNCNTFETCRWPAYDLGGGATFEVVLELVMSFNESHNRPMLPYSECRYIARSISNYVLSGKRGQYGITDSSHLSDDDWQRYVAHTHRPEVQSRRGKRSGEVRRAKSEDKRIIAQGMIDQGYTQSVIAKQLGVSKGCISKWLRQ